MHVFGTPTLNFGIYRLVQRCLSQSILQTGSFHRDELEEIESEMSQKTRLWRGIQTFEERLETWESTPFEALDIESMEAEIIRYEIVGDTHIAPQKVGQPR